MIRINFSQSNGSINGFECKGHSMSAPSGSDIICAFVSSACYMTANTITEIIGLEAETAVDDGYMKLEITGSNEKAQDILNGMKLHLIELEKDYPENIKVIITEV
ncbi:MAG: ribosomal-processing cysteine protease Prp [Eubacterium sp.]|nr:ribosomal-processing cysteine protease Prp [Eubacterium sp.]MBR7060543.1 ribosomal-processing cysteine protease Prp [Eubacterium sp.]